MVDKFDLVLMFDYENFNMFIEKIVEDFKEKFKLVGIYVDGGKFIIIFVYLMGGLVFCCLIENLDGYIFVDYLVMVGIFNVGLFFGKV